MLATCRIVSDLIRLQLHIFPHPSAGQPLLPNAKAMKGESGQYRKLLARSKQAWAHARTVLELSMSCALRIKSSTRLPCCNQRKWLITRNLHHMSQLGNFQLYHLVCLISQIPLPACNVRNDMTLKCAEISMLSLQVANFLT